MNQLLDLAYVVALGVTLWATGVGSALAHRPAEVISAASDRWRFARVVALDVIAIPLFVYAFVRVLGIPEDYAVGLIIVGAASAGPTGLAAVRIARGDVPLAVGLIVVLQAGNLVTIPIWSTILLPGHLRPPVVEVVATLVLGVLLPLLVGSALRAWRPARAPTWARALSRVSSVGLGLVVVIVLGRDVGEMVQAGTAIAFIAAATVASALLSGWVIGFPGRASRSTVALVTSVRANSVALAVASGTYGVSSDPVIAIVVFALFSQTVPWLAAIWLGRERTRAGAASSQLRGGEHPVG